MEWGQRDPCNSTEHNCLNILLPSPKKTSISRLFLSVVDLLFQVFPGLLQCLPLKEDFEENHPVYSCIIELFSDQHPLIRQYLLQLLAVFAQVLPSGTLQEGMTRTGLAYRSKKSSDSSPVVFITRAAGKRARFEDN